MRVHVIRHVAFEGPGLIQEWAMARGHTFTESLATTEEYPRFDAVDFVVVMGGPMAADDPEGSPWLLAEKRYLSRAISQRTLMLGVCLGAQLIADVAGGWVSRNAQPEIGWYPVTLTPTGAADPVFSAFPDGLVVGHWHSDTFDLPAAVGPTLSSQATTNQAFSLAGGRIVGLQFHLEWDEAGLRALVDQCSSELAEPGLFVASAESFVAEAAQRVPACREALFDLLDRMEALAKE